MGQQEKSVCAKEAGNFEKEVTDLWMTRQCSSWGPSESSRPLAECNVSRPAYELGGSRFSGDVYADEIERIVKEHNSEERLYLQIWPTLVHGPYEYPDEFALLYPQNASSNFVGMNALVSSMDHMLGRTVDVLKDQGLWETSVFVYFSDNGGWQCAGGLATNWPFRGGKKSYFEGGVRTPGFVAGGVLPDLVRGTTKAGNFHVADWYATLLRAADIPFPVDHVVLPGDTYDLWPYITAAPKITSACGSLSGHGMSSFCLQFGCRWYGPSRTCSDPEESARVTMVLGEYVPHYCDTNGKPSSMFQSAIISGDYKLIVGSAVLESLTRGRYNNYDCMLGLGPTDAGAERTRLGTINGTTWDVTGECGEAGCLFNIRDNPEETKNIVVEEPEIAIALRTALIDICTEWPGTPDIPKSVDDSCQFKEDLGGYCTDTFPLFSGFTSLCSTRLPTPWTNTSSVDPPSLPMLGGDRSPPAPLPAPFDPTSLLLPGGE
jgi:hypothetical protein